MRKTIFITDGLCLYGRACSLAFARAGYDVAFAYRDEGADALSAELERCGGKALALPARLEESGVPEAVTAEAAEALGGIDVLLCAAPSPADRPLLETEKAEIDRAYRLNYRAYLMTAKAAAVDCIRRERQGCVLFVTSIDGLRAQKRDFLRGAFHAAVHRSAETLALQLAPQGIRVNCLAPGGIEGDVAEPALGPRLPMGRLGAVEEVGAAALLLCGDGASYLTGVTLKCDGSASLAGMPENGFGYGWDPEHPFTLE